MEERIYLSENEKLARLTTGLETEAKHFVINGETADKTILRDAENKFNDKVEDYVNKLNKYEEMVKSCQKEVGKDLANLQIKPIGNYVIVRPYNENPFQKLSKTSSGIITDLGGMTPVVKSNETGDYEEEDQFIKTGVILEVGGDCKYARVGDTCFWTAPSEVPIPFFRQGLLVVNETRIIALVNDDLDSRECYNKNK